MENTLVIRQWFPMIEAIDFGNGVTDEIDHGWYMYLLSPEQTQCVFSIHEQRIGYMEHMSPLESNWFMEDDFHSFLYLTDQEIDGVNASDTGDFSFVTLKDKAIADLPF